MSKLTRENAILPTASNYSLEDRIGCAAVYGSSHITGTNTDLWSPFDHEKPNAVVIEADQNSASLAMIYGGLAGTVKVKLTEAAWIGSELYPVNDGTNIGFGNRAEINTAGDYYMCAMALENGVAGEMVEAVLCKPEAFTVA